MLWRRFDLLRPRARGGHHQDFVTLVSGFVILAVSAWITHWAYTTMFNGEAPSGDMGAILILTAKVIFRLVMVPLGLVGMFSGITLMWESLGVGAILRQRRQQRRGNR